MTPPRMPALGELLSPEAVIAHRNRRLFFEKRIVSLDGEAYALYRYPQARYIDRLVSALTQVQAAGAITQTFVGRTAGLGETLLKGHWLATSLVPGTVSQNRLSPELIASLGTTLARFHSVESDRPSRLFVWARHGLSDTHRLKSAASAAPIENPHARRWLGENLASLSGIERFQLTHGDLFGRNIIVTPDNQVALIDYDCLGFGFGGIELAYGLLLPFSRQPGNARRLLEAYLGACTPHAADAWHRFSPVFLVIAALGLAGLRQRRVGILARRVHLLGVLCALPLPAATQKRLATARQGLQDRIREAAQNRRNSLDQANRMIAYCLESRLEPLALLDRCPLRPVPNGDRR